MTSHAFLEPPTIEPISSLRSARGRFVAAVFTRMKFTRVNFTAVNFTSMNTILARGVFPDDWKRTCSLERSRPNAGAAPALEVGVLGDERRKRGEWIRSRDRAELARGGGRFAPDRLNARGRLDQSGQPERLRRQ